jgi:hypothetical protein
MGKPSTVVEYFAALPEARRDPMERLVASIRGNLPGGFEEILNYGMPSWVVPHSVYGPGYHANPKLPLPFLGLASQKAHIALYHMGIYASPPLMEWFVNAYPQHSNTRLDMGKSCIRFKKITEIPYDLIGNLCARLTPQQWIEIYEKEIRKA